MSTARERARDFVENQRAFHLGALLTESSHPKTKTLSQIIQHNVEEGIRMLQAVDAEVAPAMERVLARSETGQLVEAIHHAVRAGRRVFFTGCGATGRLSILLEAAWRRFFRGLGLRRPDLAARLPRLDDCVVSIMAGGDHALIRSVEGFEDFTEFGKHQLAEAGVAPGDVVVAITEGGETSFVIGTAWKGLATGASVFFVYNNPTELLRRHVERSGEVIDEPRITKLDLTTGPMAIAGSTRMQATTAELLVVGAALETALGRVLAGHLAARELAELGFVALRHDRIAGATAGLPSGAQNTAGQANRGTRLADDYAGRFAKLLADLASPAAVDAIARAVQWEEDIYRHQGLVTYLADAFLLDVLTDTTERAPTFRLPPFRKADDTVSARSWAFVKNPLLETLEAWRDALGREPRGLDWDAATYRALDAPTFLQEHPPALDQGEIHRFLIGREPDHSRLDAPEAAAMLILVGEEIEQAEEGAAAIVEAARTAAAGFPRTAVLCVGPEEWTRTWPATRFCVPCRIADSPLALWDHLAIKLVLNTISTATMARMGRVLGNWMHWVDPSNKKLIDRGTRLIAELTGLPYDEACAVLHETIEEFDAQARRTKDAPSPVAVAVERIGLAAPYRNR